MTEEEIIQYYVNLLILQYQNSPKALATVALNASILTLNGVQFQLQEAFDVTTAQGVQLDTIGKWVGVDRTYKGQTFPAGYFGFLNYGDPIAGNGQKGLLNYGAAPSTGGAMLTYSDIIANGQLLSDDIYRVLLQLKIASNTSNCSHSSIDNLLYQFFGNSIIATSLNQMDITYFIQVDSSLLATIILQKKVLPNPTGVGVGAINYYGVPFFGLINYGESLSVIEQDGLRSGLLNYGSQTGGRVLGYQDLINIS